VANTATTRPQQGDVVDLLVSQHAEARRLFAVLRSGLGAARQEPFEELIRLLAVHETAEEEVVYPVVRAQVPNGEALADARTEEEDRAKAALSDLEKVGVDSPEFDAQLQAVEQLVLSHANAEESEVFQRLREAISADELQALASAVEKAEKFAPTHPHPHGPESAVGNVLLGPFVAIVDRVRDAIRDARK
jgi:hemerythrin superfamily protein